MLKHHFNGSSYTEEGITNENDFEEHLLVDLHELLVPLVDVGGLAAGVDVVVAGAWGVALVVLTPLDDFLENRLVDLWMM